MQCRRVVCGLVVSLCLLVLCASAPACTVVAVGKEASWDGSVLNSHTADGWFYDSNIRVVEGQRFPEGATVPVRVNMLGDRGEPYIAAEIPQVRETYSFFRTGYSCFNERQLCIAESTIGQKDALKAFAGEKGPIMTVEQLEIFALQRAATAREAVRLIGGLAERYGFLPSCSNQGESLVITDPGEVWVLELFSVGMGWTRSSGRPGAIWAARRVPDDEVVVVTNSSRIQEVDPADPRCMASPNYRSVAVREGWYDPDSGEPFNWQRAYSPATGYWSLASMWQRERLHYIHRTLAPSGEWDPYAGTASYPFSLRPERPVSVRDIMAILRSHLEGTPFDMGENDAWIVRDVNGNAVKSDLATPFPGRAMRRLLNIPYHRPVAAKSSYTFVAQSRSGLPDAIGGVLWFAPGRPHISCYVPIYAGVRSIPESWRNYDPDLFDPDSAHWMITLADDLVNRRYQPAIRDLRRTRAPLEKAFFERRREVERKALEAFRRDPRAARDYLTDYSGGCMKRVEEAYRKLCYRLIPTYTGNRCW